MLTAFIHGMFLSFGLIIPLGLQNVFIFNQGATQPKLVHALPSVLTAFICDSILIILAVLGISLIVLQFVWLKLTLFIVGFCFLLYMGYLTWITKSNTTTPPAFKAFSIKRQIYFAMTVSFLNPHAIIDTIGVIGTSSLNYIGHHKVFFCVGCIFISLFWFFTLAYMGNLTKKFNNSGLWLNSINKLSAIIIWGVAFYLLWQIVFFNQ
jgi:L-lysine exporter family protein LysE/ArgO